MNSLFSARLLRLLATLIPLAILAGCGKGEGPRSIQNEPAAPFDGPPASCIEALTFEDICDQPISFREFEGAPGRTVDNPDQSGINPSARVAEFVKLRASSGATFGGTVVDFSAFASLDIPAGSFITAKVWSQRPVPVLLEPEGGGPGSGEEVLHGGTGWEELTFNLNFSGTITGWVFIFDNGTNGDGGNDPLNWTFYADDISAPISGGGGAPGTTLPVDFEADPATYDFGVDGGFEGGAASVIANPDVSGINTSAQVGQMQKFPGAVFGGATLVIEPTTVEAGSAFTMKVWSQRPVNVLLQPEPQGPGSGIEAAHGGTGWEELTFSLPGLSGTVSGLTLIFDNGTAGAADTDPTNWTFYFDDITLVPPGAAGELLTNGNMEAGQAPWIGQATVVDDGGNFVLQGVVTNPDPGQPFLVNASQVVTLTQDEIYTLTFRAKASVPRTILAGIGLNVDPFTSVVETVPLGTEWQAYTYTLTATGFGGADSRILFDMNAEAGNVFIDDVSLRVGSLLTNGNMEAGQAPWIGQATVVDDSGNLVLQGVVTNPDPAQPFLVNASQVVSLIADEQYVLTFKAKASVARSMITGVGLNVDPFTNTADTVALTTAWETYTCNLATTGFGGDDSRVLFDMNAEAGDVSIDDVALALLGPTGSATVEGCAGGDGGGSVPAGTTLPVDFEADAATYDFGVDGGFEGGAASVIANPQSSGINTSAQVGQMQKFPGAVFGGSTLVIEPTTVVAGSSFTMKVWSQRAVNVLLQPEPQGAGSGIETAHGGTGWEELTFSLPGLSGTVSGITLIFDNGTAGAADTDPTNWTFYFDDITLVPPDGGAGGDIAVNGGFETGTFEGWELFPNGGTQTITTDNPSSGTFAANLVVPVRGPGDPAVDNLIKNANLQAGSLTPNAPITITWDMRGSLSGAGGVVFVELFSELTGGGTSKAEIYTGGPISPDADPNVWTSYSWNTTLGPDVSGGVTLQLKTSCGPVEGCGVDVFFDNVTITIN